VNARQFRTSAPDSVCAGELGSPVNADDLRVSLTPLSELSLQIFKMSALK
jgi:hypothetical protein